MTGGEVPGEGESPSGAGGDREVGYDRHRVHPVDMEQLGIVDVEHMASQQRRHGVAPSLLQQLGLFLKAEGDGGEQLQQQRLSSDPGSEDLEEGEIRM